MTVPTVSSLPADEEPLSTIFGELHTLVAFCSDIVMQQMQQGIIDAQRCSAMFMAKCSALCSAMFSDAASRHSTLLSDVHGKMFGPPFGQEQPNAEQFQRPQSSAELTEASFQTGFQAGVAYGQDPAKYVSDIAANGDLGLIQHFCRIREVDVQVELHQGAKADLERRNLQDQRTRARC